MSSANETECMPRQCRKAKQRAIPFNCKLDAGHEGNCTPYTLAPTVQWHEAHDSIARALGNSDAR